MRAGHGSRAASGLGSVATQIETHGLERRAAGAIVLIVDDDPVVALALRSDLEETASEVLVAESGQDCLRVLTARAVDLVLLDLMLPDMSGYEVLERITQRAASRYLPVIVLSARRQDTVRALQAGAADYLTKPWQPEELRARVHTYLRLRRREVQLAEAVTRLNERTKDLESEMAERRRAEAQLIMASRMSSVGVVAAGVAHEINNPLTYLLGNLDLLRASLAASRARNQPPELEVLLGMAERSIEGAERVRLIVRDLKSFSRPDSEELEAVNLLEVIDSVLRLAAHELKHRARIIREHTEPLPPVLGNASRLSQVLLNVVANASQAMSEGNPERDSLTVRTRVLEGGAWVEVCLRDSGVGMDRATLDHAFDQFFTTKRKSAGTGLGLSLCRKIIEGFGGSIQLRSEPGHGTEVTILLPRYQEGSVPRAPASDPFRSSQVRARRVLVVDDEPAIGDVVKNMLGQDSQVEVARSGAEGLSVLRTGRTFDVLLCDLMMERVSGMELYETIVRERPELASRFVFMTGGPCTAWASAFLEQNAERVLEKPFNAQQLQEALTRVDA
jgi:signal transduction histidine kinase